MGYEKLTTKEKQVYLAKLEKTLRAKKLFLKNDFSMPDLARETGISLHVISYIINSQLNSRFTDYVNLRRIAYFKEKINDVQWKDLSVKEMMLASGFKCKTTCYRAFNKHVGLSPSEYLKANRTVYVLPKYSKTIFKVPQQ
ncbi:helix-turn-helix domain-containing protein [Flavobacterium sp. 245]|uniref:helix-turn-helix domain-containing protein n=1 Tax=Flavobacterium sp. 245 TaxID=2512115 RepID=UPI001062399E|nr:helix-turn-helix domain-containing protein [Flavobacterium sp. 245]TDO97101.1 AraC-like DNA-binding protein [Flavobacterium sp. 245]